MVHTLLSTHLVVLRQIITVTFGDIVKFVYIVDGTLTDSTLASIVKWDMHSMV